MYQHPWSPRKCSIRWLKGVACHTGSCLPLWLWQLERGKHRLTVFLCSGVFVIKVETCEVQLSWRIVLLNALVQNHQAWVHGGPHTASSQLGKKSPLKGIGAATIMGDSGSGLQGWRLKKVLYPVWFMATAAAARGAERMTSVTRRPMCGLVGRGMNILCFPALARRPAVMQGAVCRSIFRNSCEGHSTMGPWVHGTRTPFPFSC